MIYFIHAPLAGLIKIGRSRNVAKRLAELQTYSPVSLVLVGTIGTDSDQAATRFDSFDRREEERIHLRFHHLRRHGEWFEASRELLAFVEVSAVRLAA